MNYQELKEPFNEQISILDEKISRLITRLDREFDKKN